MSGPAEWEGRLYPALRRLKGKGTVAKVAEIVTQAYIDSAEYSELITVVNSVLEKNLTPELVVNFRSVFLERRKRMAEALAAALPNATAERMFPVTLHIFLHVPGLWTFCYPAAGSKKLLDEAEHSCLKFDFKVEMTLFLRMILREAII